MPTPTPARPRATARGRATARPHVRPADAPEAAVPLSSRLRHRRESDAMTRVYRTIGGGLVADFGRD